MVNSVVNIDKMIHERARLLILTYLASSEKTGVSFNELQKELDFTSGNLSIQLKKLQAAEYLAIQKSFRNNKPYTEVSITSQGSEALYRYITGAQFAQKVRAVVEAHQQMRDDLEKEKTAMLRLWKKREAQLERLGSNMLGMCGELQGVSQEALPQLEDIGLLPS